MAQAPKLTRREANALKTIKQLTQQIKAAHERIGRIRKSFKDVCSHAQAVPFKYEHDNGYGRQSQREGLMCELCLKRNHWPGMSSYWS